MQSNRDRRLPVAQAAARLGIRPGTLRKWIRRGWIRSVKMNPRAARGPRLVPLSEIERVEHERAEGRPVEDAEPGEAAA